MSDEVAKKLLASVERNNELIEALLREIRRSGDRVVSCSEAGRILGRTRQTIHEYVNNGRLHIVDRGGVKGILASELENFSSAS